MNSNEKIQITEAQYKRILKLIEERDILKPFAAENKFAEYFSDISKINQFLQQNAADFNAATVGVDLEMSDKNIDGIINNLATMSECLNDLIEDVALLKLHLKDALCALRDATSVENQSFDMVCSDEQIKSFLERYWTEDRIMTVAHLRGDFSIVIMDVVDGKKVPVYYEIIARGKSSDYDAVQEYVRNLLKDEKSSSCGGDDFEEILETIDIPDNLEPKQFKSAK